MRLSRVISLAALVAGPAVGCGDSAGPAGVTMADLVGTWSMTRLQWTEIGGASRVFDFIANGGTMTVMVAADGSVTGSGSFALTGPFTLSGSLALQVDTIMLDLQAQADNPGAPTLTFPTAFSFALSGNTLTLTNTSTVFDFGFDGSGEAATLLMVLALQ
ncbi:MAG: hypothetical protein GTN62_10175 [Gemmatimonadales bacterium]|nr:hypothetical protein [Gemmatimonadales bacterium]NIN11912.1 hypothetical protein [Gemmatimonadales bacterium]NIN50462.1 hypothetical protein [Gemmatimonadales bacterium]NIP07926.1 hypothetical protein [Gemmatimonadales bacterium]NIR01950.1 hypothetical protein [Gemmatimonadales bacterium]